MKREVGLLDDMAFCSRLVFYGGLVVSLASWVLGIESQLILHAQLSDLESRAEIPSGGLRLLVGVFGYNALN